MHKECTAKGAIVSAQRDSEAEKGERHPKMSLSSMPEVCQLNVLLSLLAQVLVPLEVHNFRVSQHVSERLSIDIIFGCQLLYRPWVITCC